MDFLQQSSLGGEPSALTALTAEVFSFQYRNNKPEIMQMSELCS